MNPVLTVVLGVALLGGLPGLAGAAEWGGITPGASTQETVRARYRAASHQSRETLEGYETTRWVYEGAQAPAGLKRMVVDFGLVTPEGYRPTLVRSVLLEPKPRIFDRLTVLDGWGLPDRAGIEEDHEVFFYRSGLIVSFTTEGTDAQSLLFVIPQREPPSKPAGR